MPQRVILLHLKKKTLVCLYNGRSEESLYSLRYSRFCQNITTGTSFVQLECLPSTSAAAVYPKLRVYYQVQRWRGFALRPQELDLIVVDRSLLPIRTDLPAAQVSLLEIIKCNCKSDCGSQRCSCRKHGLDYSTACGTYRGQSCTNSASPDFSENDE